jgi:hypothetical protein
MREILIIWTGEPYTLLTKDFRLLTEVSMLFQSDSFERDGRHVPYRVEGVCDTIVTATIVVTTAAPSIRSWMELRVLWTVQS